MNKDKEKVETDILNVQEQIFYQDKPIEEIIENIATNKESTSTTGGNSYFPSGW